MKSYHVKKENHNSAAVSKILPYRKTDNKKQTNILILYQKYLSTAAIFQLFIENPIIKPKYMHTHVVSGHQLNLIVLVNKYWDPAIFLFFRSRASLSLSLSFKMFIPSL